MEKNSRPSSERNSTLASLAFCALLLLAGCSLPDIKVDPCQVLPPEEGVPTSAHCIPINQPEKPEYDRPVNPGDVVVTADEWAKIQKYVREILRRCGDRC